MARVKGDVVETPTQEMPFKAVISSEGEIVQERFFPSRMEAEAFIVDILKELEGKGPSGEKGSRGEGE